MTFITTSLAFAAVVLAAGGLWGLHATGMTLNAGEFIQGGMFLALWLALAMAIRKFKGDPRIAHFLFLISIAVTFCMLGFVWTYTSVALQNPMIDAPLAAFDEALGFNWPDFYRWAEAHDNLRYFMILAYNSFVLQACFLLIYFCCRGWIARAWELSWLFWMSLFICEIISRLWLSVGAYGHFNIASGTPYVREYMALYNQNLRVIGSGPAQGIIQFPSFHAAAAVIYIHVTRDKGFLFPLFLFLNLLMLVALLPCGGHYLADMLGGIVVAVAAILMLRHFGNGDNRNYGGKTDAKIHYS